MPKIIKFKTYTDNVIDFIDSLKKTVNEEKVENIMIACKCRDGSVLTGYTKNLDWGIKQELIGHIQADIIDEMIKINYMK